MTDGPLRPQPLELICEKAIGTCNRPLGPGEALRRVMECVASGILLPGQSAAASARLLWLDASRRVPQEVLNVKFQNCVNELLRRQLVLKRFCSTSPVNCGGCSCSLISFLSACFPKALNH